MEVTLAQILAEIKSVKVDLKDEMMTEIKDLKKDLRSEMQDLKEDLRTEWDEKLQEQTKVLRTEFDAKLQSQTKEITQDYQDLIHYLEKKHKRQERINDEMLRELRENRLAHQSYDARLYKIESSQSNLETKLYNILPA